MPQEPEFKLGDNETARHLVDDVIMKFLTTDSCCADSAIMRAALAAIFGGMMVMGARRVRAGKAAPEDDTEILSTFILNCVACVAQFDGQEKYEVSDVYDALDKLVTHHGLHDPDAKSVGSVSIDTNLIINNLEKFLRGHGADAGLVVMATNEGDTDIAMVQLYAHIKNNDSPADASVVKFLEQMASHITSPGQGGFMTMPDEVPQG